jgi:Flp pilus assembly pilin Flp
MNNLRRFLRDENGQDMVEYALLASFISIVAIAAIRAIGPLVNIYIRVRDAYRGSFAGVRLTGKVMMHPTTLAYFVRSRNCGAVAIITDLCARRIPNVLTLFRTRSSRD